MKRKTVTLIGATGLIGGHLLELLQHDDFAEEIKVVVRRPVSFNHPKIQVIVIDFSDEISFREAISGSDAVFCTVGTTNHKTKGDKTAYRKVDYDIPVNAAKYCSEAGSTHFLLVSSVGANSKSNNFYLQLKGEVEDRVRIMNIPAVSVFRPSMLLGKRQEFRLGETIAQALMVPVSYLIPPMYRPIKAFDVAKSMVAVSKIDTSGFHIYHYKEMKNIQEV